MEKPLNIKELQDFLGCVESTILQYNREGMPRFWVGKEVRYVPEDVIGWLKERSLSRIHSSQEKVFDVKEAVHGKCKS